MRSREEAEEAQAVHRMVLRGSFRTSFPGRENTSPEAGTESSEKDATKKAKRILEVGCWRLFLPCWDEDDSFGRGSYDEVKSEKYTEKETKLKQYLIPRGKWHYMAQLLQISI